LLGSVVPDDDERERLNRELIELLNELRVVLPGVQVLFAFLLILPFSKGFAQVTRVQRLVYIAAVLFTTLSTILLLAPSSYHRLRFRDHQKERLIEISSRLVIAGMAALALAIDCAVYVTTSYVFEAWVGIVAVALASVGFAGFWYVLPFMQPDE
jgi:Family of unknown function (DUF6328)